MKLEDWAFSQWGNQMENKKQLYDLLISLEIRFWESVTYTPNLLNKEYF